MPDDPRPKGAAARNDVLANLNALVIGGGGGGIGRAITRALAAAGSAVAIADIDVERADAAAAEVAVSGATAVGLTAYVRSAPELKRLMERARSELGSIDILVTVVGGQLAFAPAARVHEIADQDWELIVDVNLRYVVRAVQLALRAFLEQGTGGAIVSVGSITGLAGSPLQSSYGVAKAGLSSLARSVAAEYSREGIRMNIVACGPIATPVAQEAQAGGAVDWIPMGRPGSTDEVAAAAVFLASPLSSYVTGQTLVVDGGAAAIGPFPALVAE